jgi:hypothetical protein
MDEFSALHYTMIKWRNGLCCLLPSPNEGIALDAFYHDQMGEIIFTAFYYVSRGKLHALTTAFYHDQMDKLS